MNLSVRPRAAADIEDAHSWYESQRRGLGGEFLDAISAVFAVLRESPQRYRVVHRDTRRANVRRFPFGVFYRIIGEDVVVIACFHARRDPRSWRGRT